MITTFILFILSFFWIVKPAQAYIDPGAGSYFIQIAIGMVLGGLYLIKNFWKSIVSFTTKFLKNCLTKFTHGKKDPS